MDQTAREDKYRIHDDHRPDLLIPQGNDDDIMKEIMKISTLEYQKQNGALDLSHIRRNKNKVDQLKN